MIKFKKWESKLQKMFYVLYSWGFCYALEVTKLFHIGLTVVIVLFRYLGEWTRPVK